jgi:hypothetical protein
MADKSLSSALAYYSQDLSNMTETLKTVLQPHRLSVREITQGGKNVGPELYCMVNYAPMRGF